MRREVIKFKSPSATKYRQLSDMIMAANACLTQDCNIHIYGSDVEVDYCVYHGTTTADLVLKWAWDNNVKTTFEVL